MAIVHVWGASGWDYGGGNRGKIFLKEKTYWHPQELSILSLQPMPVRHPLSKMMQPWRLNRKNIKLWRCASGIDFIQSVLTFQQEGIPIELCFYFIDQIKIWFSYMAGWIERTSRCGGVLQELVSFKVFWSSNKRMFLELLNGHAWQQEPLNDPVNHASAAEELEAEGVHTNIVQK